LFFEPGEQFEDLFLSSPCKRFDCVIIDKGPWLHARVLVLTVAKFYLEIVLIEAFRTLRVNVGLWTPLLPS